MAHLDDAQTVNLRATAAAFRRIQKIPGCRIWLVLQHGQVVGSFTLLVLPLLSHDGGRMGLLESVVVAPHARGQGIGEAMIQHAMALCRKSGCYKLALSSNLKRRRAHSFYRSLGFRQHGLSLQVDLDSAHPG